MIFPLAVSAAAQLTDRPAPTNVASLAQISFVAFLLGLLGYIAEYFGIRWSFGIGLPLVILSIVCVGALGTRPLKHEVEVSGRTEGIHRFKDGRRLKKVESWPRASRTYGLYEQLGLLVRLPLRPLCLASVVQNPLRSVLVGVICGP